MKLVIVLFWCMGLLLGNTKIELKPKSEPTIISEKISGNCSKYVIENRTMEKVIVSFGCGTDLDSPELSMDPQTRVSVDMCDSRPFARAPHCFIVGWRKE